MPLIDVTVLFLPKNKEIFNYYFVTLFCAFFFFSESFLIAERSHFLYHAELVFLQEGADPCPNNYADICGHRLPLRLRLSMKDCSNLSSAGSRSEPGAECFLSVGSGLHLARCGRLRLSDKARNRGLCTAQ